MSKICLRGGDEEVCPSLSVVPVAELCNQQCSGLFLAMLVSVRLSVVRKGPRSALACLSASSCGGGEEACPSLTVKRVKKLVVGPWVGSTGPPLVCTGRLVPSAGDTLLALIGRVVPPALRTTAKAFAKDVFINQERKLGARRRSDTVLVSTINDADQGSADVTFRTPPAPYEKSKFLGSGGSMVARLKLKGIDGRAPPGVEPAA
ncbi:hypothetical protein DVH24_009753 [Malus domestica]|uniref:Uncharacterized protein n=2 Tax=Malus domestica TaxID=3750 RepID=A0A498KR63_MALDO|nr:hypothetical protein DVH24_009753 [Malus domestica]